MHETTFEGLLPLRGIPTYTLRIRVIHTHVLQPLALHWIQIYCTVLNCPPFCSVVLFMPPPQAYVYVIQPSTHIKKVDGSWRLCGVFRLLNLVTEPDVYLLPNMLDFAAKAVAVHQIPVNPEDVQKTAIAALSGLVEYKRMPFSLTLGRPPSVDWAIIKCEGQPLPGWMTLPSAEPRRSM